MGERIHMYFQAPVRRGHRSSRLGGPQALSMHGWEEFKSCVRKISDMRSGVQTRRAFRRTVRYARSVDAISVNTPRREAAGHTLS